MIAVPLAGCARRPVKTQVQRLLLRNVRCEEIDGERRCRCELASAGFDAKSGERVLFCK